MGAHDGLIAVCKLGWLVPLLPLLAAVSAGEGAADLDTGLVGYWKLAGDCRDYSGRGNHGAAHGVDLSAAGPDGAASFDGLDDWIEVPHAESLAFRTDDLSVSVWVETEDKLDDVIGDLLSKYDPVTRRGLNLNVKHHAGMTCSQSNYRNLHFGIDSGRLDPEWTDCGRPGNAVFIMAMAVFEGDLYVGTFETQEGESGHVRRYAGGTDWEDCGSPDRSNSVMALAVHDGHLYAGTGCYRARGSALPDSPNTTPGGHVYRYEGGQQWTDCGQLGEAGDVFALTVYRGDLYAMPIYLPGIFRHDGGTSWVYCGTPGDQRAMSLGVYDGHLYSAGNGMAGVWRYEGGERWRDCGRQGEENQTYSFAVYEGELYAGTWPSGSVWRYDGDQGWQSVGRLGEEKEVMALAVYNGKLYAGTLPLGQVYRYERDGQWTLTGQLDTTPDVTYRRVWTMAVYNGKLFAGTLPSGRVLSIEAGKSATHDRELPPGWRHLAAVKARGKLCLYIDGEQAAESSVFDPADYDISNEQPLKIGFGAHDYFRGEMRELRIYDRALSEDEVRALAR
jgi:hypothetical protein